MEGEHEQNDTYVSFYQQIVPILNEVDAPKFLGQYFIACI